jgi:hypothetical protein
LNQRESSADDREAAVRQSYYTDHRPSSRASLWGRRRSMENQEGVNSQSKQIFG